MDKLKMHSPDLSQQNIEKIRALFPNCVTEAQSSDGSIKLAIDFEQLKQELKADLIEETHERYELNWPGKKQSKIISNAPTSLTLRPKISESVNFSDTKNIFIEGDNLDALKLLQEIYLGKVNLVYIDPPYNRKKGDDLIYNDDFVGNTHQYLARSNQVDVEGRILSANPESNGRFHSDWLSMMYQRLRLVRNILADDGVVLISIDDNEVANTKKICEEIFGENNFVGTLIWKNATDNNPTNVAIEHESIHIFARNKTNLSAVWKSDISDVKQMLLNISKSFTEKFSDPIALQSEYSKWFKENKSQLGPLDRYKYIDSGGVYTGSQSVHNPGKEGYRYDVIHPISGKACKQPLMGYRFPKQTIEKLLSEGKILFGDDETKIIELKVYVEEFEEKLSSVFELDGRTGPYDLKDLFPDGTKVFSNPKPLKLIERLISFAMPKDGICLDLFAGSSTVAHATLNLNARDGGHRKFISIQFPELIDGKSKDSKLALDFCKKISLEPYISEISKERIRRAGEKISGSAVNENWNRDIGFRVFKIDSSNLKQSYYSPDDIQQDLLSDFVDHLKEDRSEEDLLFQVFLDLGLEPSLKFEKIEIDGVNIFMVEDNALCACFDSKGKINKNHIEFIAKKEPLRAIFRDLGFASDDLKLSLEQIFRAIAPHSEVRTL